MADYDNKLSGVLFRNDKGDNPKRPDYKGSYTDGAGNEFWVSAWVKDGAKGKFMSFTMQAKEQQPNKPHVSMQQPSKQDATVQYEDQEDTLPF